eukprot:TRINITY_DN24809_c0_g1_i1.p1 TRINITY_DN24809_c0_g1~~TRINITY_DN24809_c0_g1_i1.p1  ORF type:complete len:625 (+),score=168.79 TRINITY_DN24809_c0_g1_i1:46-1920(+)
MLHKIMMLLLLTAAVEGRRGLGFGKWGQVTEGGNPSSVNCTWKYFEQKLDHFGPSNYTYMERYCYYDKYWKQGKEVGYDTAEQAPIFFYTGNESPVEEYVNNTGLMWEMGAKMGALIVFAEHRYEGQSIPKMYGMDDCISYCTSAQALADYSVLIKHLKTELGTNAPVIAFGGSYGGMLAGWMRIKYPDVITGSIAGSAPVSGFPSIGGKEGLDSSSSALSRGLSSKGGATDSCYNNLRSTWPLINELGRTAQGRSLLAKAAKRCEDTVDATTLINWGQVPWFFMGEGDYPFPSIYITYSVGSGKNPLPAWPMRKACSKGLENFTPKVEGSVSELVYNITMGDLKVNVNWGTTTSNIMELTEQQILDSHVLGLVTAMTDAAGVWHNLTGSVSCYTGDQSEQAEEKEEPVFVETVESDTCESCPPCEGCPECPLCNRNKNKACTFNKPVTDPMFAWDPICCNEDLYLSCTYVQGVGRDIFWPPNEPKGYTLETVIGPHKLTTGCQNQFAPQGLFGTPTYKDNWSNWVTSYYHSVNVSQYTNIVWSNGALDPWSGGGVYPKGGGALGPMVQNITADGSSVALVIDLGAHHLDLFFATPNDPPSAIQVRKIEEQMIRKWSQQHYDSL